MSLYLNILYAIHTTLELPIYLIMTSSQYPQNSQSTLIVNARTRRSVILEAPLKVSDVV